MDEIVQQTVEAARHLASLGLSPGTTGNISCRIDDTVYMSSSGTRMGSLGPSQLSVLEHGRWSGPKPTKEHFLHMAFYERNPSATCVVHLHSPMASAASCLEPWADFCTLPPLSPYFVMKVGNLPLIPYRHPGSAQLGELISEKDLPFDCALLANHGLVAAGSVDEAIERSIEIENSAGLRIQLARLKPRALSHENCRELAQLNARPWGDEDFRL